MSDRARRWRNQGITPPDKSFTPSAQQRDVVVCGRTQHQRPKLGRQTPLFLPPARMLERSQALDLGEDIFRLVFYFQLRQVALEIVCDAEPFLDRVEHLERPCDLVLCQQPHVQRQIRATASRRRRT